MSCRPTPIFLMLLVTAFSANAQNAASVHWGLAGDQSVTTTTGALEGFTETSSGLAVSYDATYTGFEAYSNIQKFKPSDNGGAWLAEAGFVSSRFVELALSPLAGVTFIVDSLTLLIAAKGTNNLSARIAFSRSSSFSPDSVAAAPFALISTGFSSKVYKLASVVAPGETLRVRIYPWNTTGDNGSTSKYLYLRDVVIAGTTSGSVVASLTTLSTTPVSKVSLTTAFSGGTISADGGAPVTQRGVCVNTSGEPTTADTVFLGGSGTGSFVCEISNLQQGTSYFLRAFATNSAGTAYGEEKVFTTLSSLAVPTVTTYSISSIRPTMAAGGGTITAWGGTEITARGICWNTTGSPTVADAKTIEGTGEGTFASSLNGLIPSTSYHVRAYATNATGTGYGNEVTFVSATPQPPLKIVVAKDGSGDYSSIQAAFDAVPSAYSGPVSVFVKKGTYDEKMILATGKINVRLIGESRDSTILTHDDYSGKVVDNVTLGTSTSYTLAIDADDFTASTITIRNTSTAAQAVALRTNGDRQSYLSCNIVGYQDTYYVWGGSGTGRVYNKNCLIEGSVDFIFGRDIVVFDSCTIRTNRNNGTLTAASTDITSSFGLVFLDCVISTTGTGFDGNPITSFHLGRPWQGSPRTVFLRCSEPAGLAPAGWLAWNVTPALYGEHNCAGPGFNPAQRVSWSAQLADSAAATYTLANIFSRGTSPNLAFDWIPDPSLATSVNEKGSANRPFDPQLGQNYPNPFNPSTAISYSVARSGRVLLEVFDILGRHLMTLVDEEQKPGLHTVAFDASTMTSGTYIYRLSLPQSTWAKRMVLLR